MEDHEGSVPYLGYQLYYRSVSPSAPHASILTLHGGPGSSHDYLLSLQDLTRWGYRVVFFDQLGCGRSEIPPGTDLFTLEHNVAEAEAVRSELGLDRVHLVGSSYGGLLALAYAIQYSDRLRSLTTVGGLPDVPFAAAEMSRLLDQLAPEDSQAIRRHELKGEFQHPDYLRAVDHFYHQFLCRLDPWPPEVSRSMQLCAERPVYPYMNGPNEFTISGTIRDIDLRPDLPKIRVPTLILGGKYDEVTPAVAEQIHSGIPGSRRITFPRSSHMPFWEEREAFMEAVAGFLTDVDGVAPGAAPEPR